jgi:hypothetical protein
MSSPVRSWRAAFIGPKPKAVGRADQLDDATSSEISRSPFDIPRDTWAATLFSKTSGRGLGRSSEVADAKILDWTYNRENSARLLRRLMLKANPIVTVRAHSAFFISLVESPGQAQTPRKHQSNRNQGTFEGDRIFDIPEATQAANLVSAFSDSVFAISSGLR